MDSSSRHPVGAILAIETSLRQASVCVTTPEGGRQEHLPMELPTTQTLVPTVARLLEQTGCPVNELSCVVVDCGPGSFTGLRIGLTFAKTFCFAAQIPVIGVSSLRVLTEQYVTAERVDREAFNVIGVSDAQRKQFFAAGFHFDRAGLREQFPPQLVDEAWLAAMCGEGWVLVGPVVDRLKQQGFLANLDSAARSNHRQAIPLAGSLAEIAKQRLADGQLDDLWTLKPLYLRPSAAEEKAASA
ncbi:MAG: tRNA (adenosine(37)-N6)-threonylcarbamoyltransferase complex dimerization subunit type 1 TsaB [Pirellulaceae bacterium]